MNEQSDTRLVEFQGWTLRVRDAEGEPARLMLLVHGWTGDENSMWVFARHVPADYRVLAPRAPHTTRPAGYSWRVRPPGQQELAALEDLRPVVADLIEMVDALGATNSMAPASFDLMGFSQGAALVCALALLHPERVHNIVMLAGFVPEGAEALAKAKPLVGKRAFIAHGTQDDLVSVDEARKSEAIMRTAGAEATLCLDDVGHKVSARCLRELQAFLLS